MARTHTLVIYEPGHFHAALTLKSANPRVSEEVHVYARPGPELEAFRNLVASFNARDEAPTSWRLRVHEGPEPLRTLIDERVGDIVVLAGRNRDKLAIMRELHAAGFNVFADKPWITDDSSLADLAAVTAPGGPLCVDIMTERFDTVARLRKRLLGTSALLGAPARGSEPAFEIGSTHHLYKVVNGTPLRRPAWYYDVRVQGDGLVDIQTHMTDQAQWLFANEQTPNGDNSYALRRVERWATEVSRELFEESTGLDAFPESLAEAIEDGCLKLFCNGEIEYCLNGFLVRQTAVWGQREPAGSGDRHHSVLRAEQGELRISHNALAGHEPELHFVPTTDSLLEADIKAAAQSWQAEFPGLAVSRSGRAYAVHIPAAIRTSHESHFAMALEQFLDYLDEGQPTHELRARIRARHSLLARAYRMAQTG